MRRRPKSLIKDHIGQYLSMSNILSPRVVDRLGVDDVPLYDIEAVSPSRTV